jgi:hypothetical protein
MAIGTNNMFSDLVPSSGPAVRTQEDYRIQPGTAQNLFGRTSAVTGTGSQPSYAVHGGNPNPTPHPGTTGSTPGTTPGTTTPGTTTGTTTPGSPSALSAFDQFYNSPAYQVPLTEGLKAVNTKYAAMGALESGAAMKAINDYAAGHAASALSTYMDDLYRQEALGEAASSSLAGVGQNLVSQVSANNNAAGSAVANGQLINGQASANNWNNIGSAIGTGAGAIAGALGSSYHPSNALMSVSPDIMNPQPLAYMPGGFY